MPRVARTLAVGMGLLGAVVAGQGPEFAQQYRQRLGGAIDELRHVVERFDADARASGETRESAIARLKRNADELAARQGAAMEHHAERLSRLERQLRALSEPASVARLVALLREADPDLARATYRSFEPAVPVTEEGVLATLTGLLAGWAGTLGIALAGRRALRGWRAARARDAVVGNPAG